MYKSSLSQNVGKRANGKRCTHASVADINARSHTRCHSSTGAAYTVVNSGGLIKVEFSQTGTRHDETRAAVVGQLTPNGFRSYSAVTFMGYTISWDELAELIGMGTDALMKSVAKFAKSQAYQSGVSSTSRYSHQVANRRKKAACDRVSKGVRIC